MPIPILVWMAAGVGAAGIKLFKDAQSPKAIIESTVGRYKEEKYRFFTLEQKALPTVENIAEQKLSAWNQYKRVFAVIKKIENRPPKYSFKSHEDLRLMQGDIDRLSTIANLVDVIKEKKLDKIGTGLCSVITLHGGAATLQAQEEGQEKPEESILEKFVSSSMDSTELSEMEEYAVINNLLRFPPLVEDKELDNIEAETMDKNKAFAFKEDLDKKSLAIADARERLKRLLEILVYIEEKITKLRELHLGQIEYLENLVKTKTDYTKFDDDEKGHLSYTIALGFVLREAARTDVIISNDDIATVNRDELHKVLDKSIDLIPIQPAK